MYQNCCKKCGSTELFMKEQGSNTGLYCSDCGAWIKWLNKEEKRAFENADKKLKQPKSSNVDLIKISCLYYYKGSSNVYLKLKQVDGDIVQLISNYGEVIGEVYTARDLSKIIIDLESGKYA